MRSGDVTMRRTPKPKTTHKSIPIQISQTASRIHASSEFGGIVSERRFHRTASCIDARRHRYLLPRRIGAASADGSSIVITLLAPRSPHGGGAPSPTRIVITGNGGASSGHGVWQSLTIDQEIDRRLFRS